MVVYTSLAMSVSPGMEAKAWPFKEARDLLARVEKAGKPADDAVIFETGYGPSGLPHIGTFAEVARTTMIRRAFARLSDRPTRLIAFSDDMDGLRKVPDNIPNQAMVETHLGKPLTQIPDPFGDCHESFGHHNNSKLQAFLDDFGFEYEFFSSTACYTSGRFDDALRRVLECYDDVIEVILPTLGAERRRTYSPFLPVSEKNGRVLQVPVVERNVEAGTIVYEDEDGSRVETPVTGGRCKLQWKADWAMRWYALGVDYEMSGKDLMESVKLSSKICRILGGTPPLGLTYELFLDEQGQKISKSKGNGLSIEEWLRYASPESLSLFMYKAPRKATKLYFDVIPRYVDEYLVHLQKYRDLEDVARLESPIFHIHGPNPPDEELPLSFAVLLNLASVCNAEDKAVLWGFIDNVRPGATPEKYPLLDQLVGYALVYYNDFVKPAKAYRAPTDVDRAALEDLAATLEQIPADADAETFQEKIYEVGKRHPYEPLRAFFGALYEVLLGQPTGPRFGSFVQLYGRDETIALIRRALAGELQA